MLKQRKIPMRMCVACREMKPKRDLMRIVVPSGSEDNAALFDPKGKLSGRGAYLCRSADCLKKAQKTKAVERALSCTLSEETLSILEKEVAEDHAV